MSSPKQEISLKKQEKIRLILEKATLVFKRKGFVDVVMQDIVDECGISRGGLYKYFGTTAEIFENILRCNLANDDILSQGIEEGEDFITLIDQFLEQQKHELINLKDSLRVASYEYFLKNRSADQNHKIKANLTYNISIVEKLLKYGLDSGKIRKIDNISGAAMHFVIWLEGMNLTSIVASLDAETITTQLETFKKLIVEGEF